MDRAETDCTTLLLLGAASPRPPLSFRVRTHRPSGRMSWNRGIGSVILLKFRVVLFVSDGILSVTGSRRDGPRRYRRRFVFLSPRCLPHSPGASALGLCRDGELGGRCVS